MNLKEIVIISGKGGTGKTTVTASLIPYFKNIVIADCDVDAPDLDILIKPEILSTRSISASQKAIIDSNLCISCGKCHDVCRFSALSLGETGFKVDPIKCEGCKTCTLVCPVEAIRIEDFHTGELYESKSAFGPMIHARLSPGEEVSGRLVSMVRSKAKVLGQTGNYKTVLIDGPPGVACNVISSITGADLAILVTEPTISGFHDLIRVHDTATKVRVPTAIIVNKEGLSQKFSQMIDEFAKAQGISILGRIPLSKEVRTSTNREKILSLDSPDFPFPQFWECLVERIENILYN